MTEKQNDTTPKFIAERNFLILVALLLLIQGSVFSQSQVGGAKKRKVKLVNWSAGNCDGSYDPSRLNNRITDYHDDNGHTFISVNFTDHCCPTFKPILEFKKGKLNLSPYDVKDGPHEVCFCDCCFTIQFEIDGLMGREYTVYFKGTKIERSDDPYKVVEPSNEVYQGVVINRRNKYGFKEGLWISFYSDSSKKNIKKYPESNLNGKDNPIWTKEFYTSGSVSFFSRNDTIESWFEDGKVKSQYVFRKGGDTTYRYELARHKNSQLARRHFWKMYPAVFTSEFDPSYRGKGSAVKVIYNEDYYENGKPRYLYGKDTSYSWYESGKIETKAYTSGRIKYDEGGFVIERAFHWKQKGTSSWGDFNHSLYVDFNRKGKVSKVRYVRDEVAKEVDGIVPDVN